MVATVHQFVPTLRRRDAVGNHSLVTAQALAGAGIATQNWVEEADEDVPRRPVAEFPAGRQPGAVLYYQASTSAADTVDLLRARPEPLSLCYHNITPAELFRPYEPDIARRLDQARQQMSSLCERVSVAVADSDYNAQELRAWGVADVSVAPPYLLPPSPADGAYLQRLRESRRGLEIVFVGRVMPQKGHLELLRTVAALRAGVDPQARLHIVGGPGPPLYMHALARVRDRLGLDEQSVVVTGSLSDGQVAAHYEAADVYLSMSAHEGFGVPLIEAMSRGVPVVALGSTAVPETMGGAGVVLGSADPAVAAEVIARIAADQVLRESLRERGRRRAREVAAYPRLETIVDVLRRAEAASS